jgi:hypothetical protein
MIHSLKFVQCYFLPVLDENVFCLWRLDVRLSIQAVSQQGSVCKVLPAHPRPWCTARYKCLHLHVYSCRCLQLGPYKMGIKLLYRDWSGRRVNKTQPYQVKRQNPLNVTFAVSYVVMVWCLNSTIHWPCLCERNLIENSATSISDFFFASFPSV